MFDGACSGWIGEGDVGASDWRRKSVMLLKNDSPSHGGSVGDWWHQLVMLMFPFGDYEHDVEFSDGRSSCWGRSGGKKVLMFT